MLEVTRYVNSNEVARKDLANYRIESEAILKTIKTVNNRLTSNFPQDTFAKETVENAPDSCYTEASVQVRGE